MSLDFRRSRVTPLGERAVHFLSAALIMPVLLQATQSDSFRTASEEKTAPPVVIEVRNLLGAVGPVTVEIIPGSESGPYREPAAVTPTKACVHGAPLSSCFETVGEREFGRPVTAQALDLGEGHSGLLLTATVNDLAASTRMVAVLGLSGSGQLVNLLPFAAIGNQDQFQHWQSGGSSVRLTVANVEWGPERHFLWQKYPYRLKSYIFCSDSEKFVLADQFVTKGKYAMKYEGQGGMLKLSDLLPRVDVRLARRGSAGCRRQG